jgi:hypothetical protein
MLVPVRKWLPLKANRGFVKANQEVRRLLRESIRERKARDLGGGEDEIAVYYRRRTWLTDLYDP